MKFLLDQGLPRSAAQHLKNMGIESEHVGALGLEAASDKTILEQGCARGDVVVTLDSDFHALLAVSNASMPSVIRIRIEGLKGESVARIIRQLLDTNDLLAGAAVTVTEHRVRLRRLPIIPRDHAGEEDAPRPPR